MLGIVSLWNIIQLFPSYEVNIERCQTENGLSYGLSSRKTTSYGFTNWYSPHT